MAMSDYAADDIDIKAALRREFASPRRKSSGSVKGRKDAEKRAMLSPTDGRLSHRGDTEQLNVSIDRELKVWLARARVDHDMRIFEIVERGLALVRAELEGKGGKRDA